VVRLEQLQARMVNGEEISIDDLCVLASSVRLSQRLGLERARSVGATLSDILSDRRRDMTTAIIGDTDDRPDRSRV
jgi:hypothetical protein